MGVRLFVTLLACALLVGCANDRTLPIATWTLAAPDGESSITAPSHFDDRLPREPTRYTLRARVTLPDDLRGRDLTLAIPQLFALASLRVNERDLDPVDAESGHGYRGVGPHRWRIPRDLTSAGALDLALHVDHTWTQSAWLDTAPRLSATPQGDRGFRFVRTFNEVTANAALTTLLMAAFVYGVVFLLDRHRKAYGWFALHAMGAAYPAFQVGLLQTVVGPWDVVVMAVLVVLGNVSAVYFTHAQFDLGPPSRAWGAACVVTLLAVPFAHGPFASTRVFGPLAMTVTIANVVYQIVFFARRFARERAVPLHTLAIFSSWTILGALAIADFAWWFGLGEPWGGAHGAHLGIVGIALLQSAALAHEHGRSLRTADALNEELAGRVALLEKSNDEVQHLNNELRRQIGARSRQLSELLAGQAPRSIAAVEMRADDVVEGRYRVVRAIGEGGMGAVYEVRRLKDDRRLALKVLHTTTTPEAMARFAREAQLASQMDHPSIVAVVDVDVTANGTLFLVMEFVDGPSLESERARFGDVPWALAILRDIAGALAAIHERGIVHRDLKPANVLLAGGSRAKIADFGISTLTREGDATSEASERSPLAFEGAGPLIDPAAAATQAAVPLARAEATPGPGSRAPAATPDRGWMTSTGAIMGTPMYMAPEMFQSARKARPATDVFSFGVIACELLTRRHPFDGSVLARLRRGSTRPPSSIALAVPSLAEAVAECIDRCLSADPANRPTASELVAALA